MKQAKQYLRMINPFNDTQEIPNAVYVMKKILAFIILYYCAAVIGEAIIIGGVSAMGYDPLHGEMPAGSELFPYYGYSIFILCTVLYCKLIEKRNLRSMGFSKSVWDYIVGAGIAVIILAVIMGMCCITGCISYEGISKNANYGYLVILFGGFIIQSMGEEVLCRGFLMPTLLKKVSMPVAVFISSTAFAFPHFSSLFEMEMQFRIVGALNLYLISVIFSLLILCRSNIWVACGLHGVWNFLLYGVFGLNLSGNEANAAGILSFKVETSTILNGGIYGIESSIITTIVLAIAAALLYKWYSGNRKTKEM